MSAGYRLVVGPTVVGVVALVGWGCLVPPPADHDGGTDTSGTATQTTTGTVGTVGTTTSASGTTVGTTDDTAGTTVDPSASSGTGPEATGTGDVRDGNTVVLPMETSADHVVTDLVALSEGDLALLGSTSYSDVPLSETVGCFVALVDARGVVQAPGGIDSDGEDLCVAGLQRAGGGQIGVGWTDFTGADPTAARVLLMDLDLPLQVNAIYTFGVDGDIMATAVAEGPSGDIFVAGTTTGGGFGGQDGMVMRLDASFDVVWATVIGGTGDDFLNAMLVTETGVVAVGRRGVANGFVAWGIALDANGGSLFRSLTLESPGESELFGVLPVGGSRLMTVGTAVGLAGLGADAIATLLDFADDPITALTVTAMGGDAEDIFWDVVVEGDVATAIGTTTSAGPGRDLVVTRFTDNGDQLALVDSVVVGHAGDENMVAPSAIGGADGVAVGWVDGEVPSTGEIHRPGLTVLQGDGGYDNACTQIVPVRWSTNTVALPVDSGSVSAGDLAVQRYEPALGSDFALVVNPLSAGTCDP